MDDSTAIFTVKEIVQRIELKLDNYDERLRKIETKVDKAEGSISFMKWIGPVGMAFIGVALKLTEFIGK